MRRIVVVLLLLFATVLARAGSAVDVAEDPALETRVQRLSTELRCLVCQNQSLADSHAPLALDLKNQVREQLRSGRSEDQVVAYMTERYGDFVRYRPPWRAATLLLWLGPALLAAGGLGLLLRALRHRASDPLPSDAESAQAQALLARERPQR